MIIRSPSVSSHDLGFNSSGFVSEFRAEIDYGFVQPVSLLACRFEYSLNWIGSQEIQQMSRIGLCCCLAELEQLPLQFSNRSLHAHNGVNKLLFCQVEAFWGVWLIHSQSSDVINFLDNLVGIIKTVPQLFGPLVQISIALSEKEYGRVFDQIFAQVWLKFLCCFAKLPREVEHPQYSLFRLTSFLEFLIAEYWFELGDANPSGDRCGDKTTYYAAEGANPLTNCHAFSTSHVPTYETNKQANASCEQHHCSIIVHKIVPMQTGTCRVSH